MFQHYAVNLHLQRSLGLRLFGLGHVFLSQILDHDILPHAIPLASTVLTSHLPQPSQIRWCVLVQCHLFVWASIITVAVLLLLLLLLSFFMLRQQTLFATKTELLRLLL